MSDHHERIDPITAERLMRGAQAGSPVDDDPLARLLAAAAIPARPGELTGEDAATTAFRTARLAAAAKSGRRSAPSRLLAKASAAKAAIALAVAAGGGIALAAGTGHLPGTSSPNKHTTARPSLTSPDSTHVPAASTAAGAHSPASDDATPPSASANGSASPNVRGLCTSFQAAARGNPGTALDNPAFTVLITRAGGKASVASYCTTLRATPVTTAPTNSGKASSDASQPTTGNSTHPSGPKTPPPSHPTTPPSHPTPSPTRTH